MLVCMKIMTLVQWPCSRTTGVSRYHNVIILEFIGAKEDGSGGDNYSYKSQIVTTNK